MALKNPHRIQRSDLPAATCSHPSVRSTTWAMPLTAKMHNRGPAGAHFCPSSITTTSCPVTARPANASMEKKVNDDSAAAHDRLSSSTLLRSLLKLDTATSCSCVKRLRRLL